MFVQPSSRFSVISGYRRLLPGFRPGNSLAPMTAQYYHLNDTFCRFCKMLILWGKCARARHVCASPNRQRPGPGHNADTLTPRNSARCALDQGVTDGFGRDRLRVPGIAKIAAFRSMLRGSFRLTGLRHTSTLFRPSRCWPWVRLPGHPR